MVKYLIHYVFITLIMLLGVGCEQKYKSTHENYDDHSQGTSLVKDQANNQDAEDSTEKNNVIINHHKGELVLNYPYEIADFITAEWVDLIPEEELEALLNPPDYLDQIEDGSIEDKITNSMKNTQGAQELTLSRYQQALVSTNTIKLLNGVMIRIPGFVVPLEINEHQVITRFFIVPYFGACIHLPPPAPNQMIHIEVKQGMRINSLYDPVWVSGKLSTALTQDDMATAAYSMEIYAIESYDDVSE